MAKTTTNIPRGVTPGLIVQRPEWIEFLARFTRENRGAHARLEILGADIGDQVETDDRPFDGIGPDVRDGEDAIWIAFGDSIEDHFTHGIQNVKTLRARPATAKYGAAVLVETLDGTKTLLELSRPEDFALPPAGR